MAKLTDALIKQTKPGEKAIRLLDEDGLVMLVQPSGARWWRFRYRFQGTAKMLSLGVYPDTSLKQAREKRDEARRLLADGVDPGVHRRLTKNMAADAGQDSFESVAREWIAKESVAWAKSHADKIIQRMERDVFPWLGKRSVREITAPEILACARRVEERGALDTAHRCKQNIGQVMRYAIAIGRAERNPVPDLQGALPSAKGSHFAAITDPVQLGKLLRAIEACSGFLSVRCALRLLPRVFTRPGELRKAEWSEFDLDGATWSIPGERMKSGQPHIVPLSTQAVAILKEIHPFSGGGQFVFPTPRNRNAPISDMSLNAALKSLGYSGEQQTCHGFRATARTLLDEVLGFRIELIEHQLAHAVRDPLGRAYNRTVHLSERRKMMQAWSDYLDLQVK
ncbi:MAG: integrase arm-type DNA-binding domain-containing protein [Magnetococcales bacterium]|nr:integrase arm-type DNA-binding domain-containing protein [Magnetococcales bacterium]